jgi:hypothetical protein
MAKKTTLKRTPILDGRHMGGTLTVLKEELKEEELGHTALRTCLSGYLQTITEVHKTLPSILELLREMMRHTLKHQVSRM